jgi:hypothetical protein
VADNRETPTVIPGQRCRYERFEIERMSRRDLHKAPYNPRMIDPAARAKLVEKLKTVGLAQPLVWNKRTGNLVSGHQRIDILDQLEGHDRYTLSVSVVDWDPATEKVMNVFLNNPSAQGTWDTERLRQILLDDALPPAVLGFDPIDIEMLFDTPDLAPHFQAPPEVAETAEQLNELAARRPKKAQKSRKESTVQVSELNDTEFYLVVVFNDRADSELFLHLLKQPANSRYIDGYRLAANLGLELKLGDGKQWAAAQESSRPTPDGGAKS